MQKYSMQQGITRMPIPIVPTERGTWSMHTDRYSADNKCHLQLSIAIMHAKVIICNCCIQKLSFAIMHTKAIAPLTQFCDFYH